jgi:hypothetical protein
MDVAKAFPAAFLLAAHRERKLSQTPPFKKARAFR